ncbi:hypothetical protein WDZ92_35080, partial [Nostoc sp. NIES-2111]
MEPFALHRIIVMITAERPFDPASPGLDDLHLRLVDYVPAKLMVFACRIPPGYDAQLYAMRLVLACEEQRPQSLREIDAIHREIRSILKAGRIDGIDASRLAFGKVVHARGILRDLLAATGLDENEAASRARALVMGLYEGSASARAEIDAICARVGLDWDTLLDSESSCRDQTVHRAMQLSARGYEREAGECRALLDGEREKRVAASAAAAASAAEAPPAHQPAPEAAGADPASPSCHEPTGHPPAAEAGTAAPLAPIVDEACVAQEREPCLHDGGSAADPVVAASTAPVSGSGAAGPEDRRRRKRKRRRRGKTAVVRAPMDHD